MLIFLVTINTGTDFYFKTERMFNEVGAESYSAKEEFSVDGVQDPYRATDESDAVVWVERLVPDGPMKAGDYNPFYGNSVLRRAVDSGKPVLYYQVTDGGDKSGHQVPKDIARKPTIGRLSEMDAVLRTEVSKLVSNSVGLKH